MANRYSTPAQAEFINYNDRLPFNQLMQVGSAMAERADKARNDLSQYIDKYSRFQSPSAQDTQEYYNSTIGTISPFVEKATSNPDWFKSAEARSEMMGLINNIDYAKISSMEQSRDNMLTRQKLSQDLSAKGLYNENWHGMDYTGYDTTRSGIFNDTAMLPYQNVGESTAQYFDNLKPSVIDEKSNGTWLATGVTDKRIRDIVRDQTMPHANTAYGKKQIEEAIATGLTTPDKALDWLAEEMYQAHSGKVYENVTANPYGTMRLQHSLALSRQNTKDKAKGNGNDGDPYSYLRAIKATSNMQKLNFMMKPRTMDKIEDRLNEMSASGIKLPQGLKQEISNITNPYEASMFIQGLREMGNWDPKTISQIEDMIGQEQQAEMSKVLFASPSAREEIKVTLPQDFMDESFGMSASIAGQKDLRHDVNDPITGITSVYGSVNPKTLSLGIPLTESGKLVANASVATLSVEEMQKKKEEAAPNDHGYFSWLPMTDNVRSSSKREELQNRSLEILGEGDSGFIPYITSNSKNILFKPSTGYYDFEGTVGDAVDLVEGEILIPDSEYTKWRDKYSKQFNFEMDGKEIDYFVKGKYGDDTDTLVEEVSLKVNKDEKPKKFHKVRMALPFNETMMLVGADANKTGSMTTKTKIDLTNTQNNAFGFSAGRSQAIDRPVIR